MNRPAVTVAALVLSTASAGVCQNTDVPVDIVFVSNSAIPQELYPGDVEQIYEINAQSGTSYNSQSTQVNALTNAGVWGHDEGPSLVLEDTVNIGDILWYWGDTVTAFQPF